MLSIGLRQAWDRWRNALDDANASRRISAEIDTISADVRSVVWSGIGAALPGLAEPDWRAGVPALAVGVWWADSATVQWRASTEPGHVCIGWDLERSMWHVVVAGPEFRRVFWGTDLPPLLLQLEHLSPEWREAYAAASVGGEP